MDLLVATRDELWLLVARLDGEYDPAVKLARWPESVPAITNLLPGDWNGDGRWSLLVGTDTGVELWVAGRESGLARRFRETAYRQPVEAEVNGDGMPDVLVERTAADGKTEAVGLDGDGSGELRAGEAAAAGSQGGRRLARLRESGCREGGQRGRRSTADVRGCMARRRDLRRDGSQPPVEERRDGLGVGTEQLRPTRRRDLSGSPYAGQGQRTYGGGGDFRRRLPQPGPAVTEDLHRQGMVLHGRIVSREIGG